MLLSVLSLLGTLAVAEISMRVAGVSEESFGGAREEVQFRSQGARIHERFRIDEELGFCPLMGPDRLYDEFGTRHRYSVDRRPGVERLLFVGDSVTAQGKIVGGLAALYGDETREYWNAGVTGYNLVQELAFYRRFNRAIEPDHIVLTFHNNDFGTTPVATVDEDGHLAVFSPRGSGVTINAWLYERLFLYRFLVGRMMRSGGERETLVAETRNALQGFQRVAEEEGAELSVLLFPILKPFDEWWPEEKQSREDALRMLEELEIRYFDLLPPFRVSLEGGADLTDLQKEPGDTWHPSAMAGAMFAQHLRERALFRP